MYSNCATNKLALCCMFVCWACVCVRVFARTVSGHLTPTPSCYRRNLFSVCRLLFDILGEHMQPSLLSYCSPSAHAICTTNGDHQHGIDFGFVTSVPGSMILNVLWRIGVSLCLSRMHTRADAHTDTHGIYGCHSSNSSQVLN